jgi:hypothetical protein
MAGKIVQPASGLLALVHHIRSSPRRSPVDGQIEGLTGRSVPFPERSQSAPVGVVTAGPAEPLAADRLVALHGHQAPARVSRRSPAPLRRRRHPRPMSTRAPRHRPSVGAGRETAPPNSARRVSSSDWPLGMGHGVSVRGHPDKYADTASRLRPTNLCRVQLSAAASCEPATGRSLDVAVYCGCDGCSKIRTSATFLPFAG